jgi:hypothetical protein
MTFPGRSIVHFHEHRVLCMSFSEEKRTKGAPNFVDSENKTDPSLSEFTIGWKITMCPLRWTEMKDFLDHFEECEHNSIDEQLVIQRSSCFLSYTDLARIHIRRRG